MVDTGKKDKWFAKGIEAGGMLSKTVVELTNFQTEGDEVEEWVRGALLIFNVALFYIVLDRQASILLPSEEREQFSKGLMQDAAIRIANQFSIPSNQIHIIADEVNAYMNMLDPYTSSLFPENGQNPKGTLYWEYSRLLHEKIGLNSEKAIASSIGAPEAGNYLWANVKHLFP